MIERITNRIDERLGARRRALIAQAHWAAKRLGLDEDDRRSVQVAITGRESCADMSAAQLARLIQHYKRLGSGITARAPDGGAHVDAATRWQLATLERVALDMGWTDGLEDARLIGFVQRTAGVQRIEWLSKRACTEVLSGLARWQRQQRARANKPQPGERAP